MMRRAMLWLHGWIGITIGAWLAVVGVTGSLLIWRPEAEPQLQAHLRRVQPQPTKATLQAVYDAVHSAYPNQVIDRIYPARTNTEAHEVRLPKAGLNVFVNPYSGKLIGTLPRQGDFYDTIDQLHVRLLSDEVGHFLVGIGGFALVTMSISGIFLWWPRKGKWKRAFVPNLRTNWRGRNYELHRVIGGLTCIFLLTCAVTGITLVWTEPTRIFLGSFFSEAKKPKIAKGSTGEWLPLDALIAQANKALPGGEITRINWPKKPKAPLVVRKHMGGELNPAGNSSVSLDPVSGKVVRIEDSRQADTVTRLVNLRYPIHTGIWGGFLMRVLYTLVGLSLPAFYVSGLFLWFLKWRARQRRRAATP